jgi:hypothetical protein
MIEPLLCVSIECFIKSVLLSSGELETKVSIYLNIVTKSSFLNFGTNSGKSNESTSCFKFVLLDPIVRDHFLMLCFCERTGSVNKNSVGLFRRE